MSGVTMNAVKLALALERSLKANIPALVDEINAFVDADAPELQDYPLIYPVTIELGITNRLIKKGADELPAIACGVYSREPDEEYEQGNISTVLYPYMIEVYIADANDKACYIRSLKWHAVLDAFVERYCQNLVYGFLTAESATTDITFALEKSSEEIFKQVIAAVGVWKGPE